MKYMLFFVCAVIVFLTSNIEASCNILKRDYIVIHKYIDGQIIKESVTTNYSLMKNSIKAYLQKQIQKKVDKIVIDVKKSGDVRFFVISYVDAFCTGKNVVYDVLSGKKAMASKLYPKSAYGGKRVD